MLTKRMQIYHAFGLTIASEMELPELIRMETDLEEGTDRIGAHIRFEDLSPLWLAHRGRPRSYVIGERQVMFHIPDTALFAVSGGNLIRITPIGQADPDLIRLYLLGTCMAVLLMQRRILPLHGSAVAWEGQAYAIVGESGAGKSTLASLLLERGFQLLSDDVIAVTFQGGQPMIRFAYPQQKLWRNSLDLLGMSPAEYRPVFGRETKYCVAVTPAHPMATVPLKGIVELVASDARYVQLNRIPKLAQLDMLNRHTFRHFLIPRMGLREWHFHACARLCGALEMLQCIRPNMSPTGPQLVRLLLDQFELEGIV